MTKYIFFFLLISTLLIGCFASSSTQARLPQPTEEKITQPPSSQTIVSVTPAPQYTNTVDPTLVAYILTPHPTMEQKPLTTLVQLLHSETCVLPCYLGITPGLTTENELKEILESLDTYIVISMQNDGHLHYSTHLGIGDELLIGLTPDPNWGATDVRIIQSVDIIVESGIVQKLSTSISTGRFITKFQEYWSRYTLREIFLQFGIPDQMVTGKRDSGGTGYDFILVYEKPRIVFTINGSTQNGFICPESEEIGIGLGLSVTNPASELDLHVPTFPILLTDREVYLPVDEVLVLGKEDIYARLISNPRACFEIK